MYDQIFMGAGDRSKAQCYDLIEDLTKAFDNICSLQQGGLHYEHERTEKGIKEDKEYLERLEEEVAATATKIFMRLTGCKSVSYLKLLRLALDDKGI